MNPGKLRFQNWLAASAHLLTGLTVIILYIIWPATHSRSTAETFRYQIAAPDTPAQCNTSGQDPPPSPDQCSVEIVFQKPKAVANWNIIYGVVAFFFITALAHVFYATDAFGSGNYSRAIQSGWNPYRWFEYGITATIMTVLIGLVDGTRDTSTLAALALMTTAMQFCGFTTESLLRGTEPLGSHARDAVKATTGVGWILFATIWGVLIYSFATLVSDVNTLYEGQTDPVRVPAWIWYVVFAQLLYYASFGVVQFVQIISRFKGSLDGYMDVELWYIYLSYFAKLSLGSGIAYGLLFRTKDCPV